MLKFMRTPSLRKLQSRLSLTVVRDNIYLAFPSADAYIQFKFILSNPTPWEVSISDVDCSIGYNTVIYVRKCRAVEPLPIQIPAETVQGKAFYFLYEPFLTTLGLPANRKGWFIQGHVTVSSNLGTLVLPIPVSENLEVGTNDTTWNKAREWVQNNMKGEYKE